METTKKRRNKSNKYEEKRLKQKSGPKHAKSKNENFVESKALVPVKKENILLYILKNNLIFIIGSLLLCS